MDDDSNSSGEVEPSLPKKAAGQKKAAPKKAAPNLAKPKKAKKTASAKKAVKRSQVKGSAKRKTVVPTPHTQSDYPRHSIQKALRIPKAILDQNAGHECTDAEAAQFCNVGYHGPFKVELSSAIKYGLLHRPSTGRVAITDNARKIIRPQQPSDKIQALREAVIESPAFGSVYLHYRGENLPDEPFFSNALTDTFLVPEDKVPEFKALFVESLEEANLLERHGDKLRVLDVSKGEGINVDPAPAGLQSASQPVPTGTTCFVMMPFEEPIGSYFEKIYKPAIESAGFRAVRADDDMFATGKIMDQVWEGIQNAAVLVAELTRRNPNVFYELGIAHTLEKPVVLVAPSEEDVPFDIRHIRVIYYDVYDPHWGAKLVDKIKENVLSAVANPQEAIFRTPSRSR